MSTYYLDYNGLSFYDSQIKSYIGTVAGGIKIISMAQAPTSSTTQYTIGGTTYNFEIGDEVVVTDNIGGTENTNYKVVYKLYDLVEEDGNTTAYWSVQQGSSDLSALMETVSITLSGGSFNSDLLNSTINVTVDGVTTSHTWEGTAIEVQIPFGVQYTVTPPSISGFDSVSSQNYTAVAGNTRSLTFTYSYKTVSVEVGTNQSDMTDLENTTISIAGNNFTLNQPSAASQTFTTHVATGASVAFTFGSVTGYRTPSITTTTANDNLSYSVNYQTTIVTCTAVVDSSAGKSTNDVTFTVNTETLDSGESIKIPTGDTITITSTDLTQYGYSCTLNPVSGTTATGTSMSFTATYQTEALTISTINVDEGSVSGATFTVNGVAKVYGTDTLTWYIPFGVSDVITHDIEGYTVTITKSPNTDVADSATKTVVVDCEIIKNGVFAYYSDGTIKSYAEADSTAIGVAIIQDDISFIIDKTNSNLKFGGYNKDLTSTGIVLTTNSTTAKQDFDGYNNTTKIISACSGYTDSSYNITGAPAAEYCRGRFSGKGYLPSLGELNVAYQYKTDVDSMLTKIGGTALTSSYYWSSTLYSASDNSWILDWNDGSTGNGNRNYTYYVRAFRAFTTLFTLSLYPLDNCPISNVTLTIVDSHNEIHTVITDSNGEATVEVPYGDIQIRSNKYKLSNGTITGVSATNNSATIQISSLTTGIFAYYSDGTMQNYNNATTSAIGVAVITNNCAFVIDKTATNSNNSIYYGGYNKDLSSTAVTNTNASTAKLDFDGENNTDRIISACTGYNDGYVTGAAAAEACRSAFNGKGYLGSLGEWQEAYNNKTDINNMITKIGGTAFNNSYYWTSTHYNASSISWELYWNDGSALNFNRRNTYYVRAFRALSI